MINLERATVNFMDNIVEDLEFGITFEEDSIILAEAIMNYKGNEAISNYTTALYNSIPKGSRIISIGIGLSIISDYDGNIIDYTDTNTIIYSTNGEIENIADTDTKFVDDIFMPIILDDIKNAYKYNEGLAQLYPSKYFNYPYKYFNTFTIKKIEKALDNFYNALISPIDKVILSSIYGTMQSDLPIKVQIDRLLTSERDYMLKVLNQLDYDESSKIKGIIMDSYNRISDTILDDILKDKEE